MPNDNDANKRRTKLLIITLIAIVALLFAGIVYQFVVIKGLEKQLNASLIYNIKDIYGLISFCL